jgi:hypothetical protein
MQFETNAFGDALQQQIAQRINCDEFLQQFEYLCHNMEGLDWGMKEDLIARAVVPNHILCSGSVGDS